MTLPKPIRWLLSGVAGLLGLLLVLLLLVSFIRILVNLESQKGMIEFLASRQINRQVGINGAIRVTTSLWPAFIIEDVRVKNPQNFGDGDFARLESARIELSLIRLLLMRIRVKEFTIGVFQLGYSYPGAGGFYRFWADDRPGRHHRHGLEIRYQPDSGATADHIRRTHSRRRQ